MSKLGLFRRFDMVDFNNTDRVNGSRTLGRALQKKFALSTRFRKRIPPEVVMMEQLSGRPLPGQEVGDPAFGALARIAARGIGAVGKKIFKKVGGKIARAGGVRKIAGKIIKGAGGVAVGVGAGAAGAKLVEGGERAPRRRRRGISSTELRGFRKVTRLLSMVGMRPRGLGRVRTKRIC